MRTAVAGTLAVLAAVAIATAIVLLFLP